MDLKSVVCRFESNQGYHASADGAVPGLLNQVMGVRISPEAPSIAPVDELVESLLSKGRRKNLVASSSLARGTNNLWKCG